MNFCLLYGTEIEQSSVSTEGRNRTAFPDFSSTVFGIKADFSYIHADIFGEGINPFSDQADIQGKKKFGTGIALSSGKIFKYASLGLKAGSLTAGGGTSSLNSPVSAGTASAFSSGGNFTPKAVTANLPSFSSFSKPFSLYLYAAGSSPDKDSFLQKIIFSGITTGYASLLTVYKTENYKIYSGITAGQFSYDENRLSSYYGSDGLYKTDLFYNAGKHLCSSVQISIINRRFSMMISTGFFESPFGTVDMGVKLDSKINFKKLTLIFSGAGIFQPYTEAESLQHFYLLTASGRKIKDCMQLRAGIQKNTAVIIKIPVLIKIGTRVNFEKGVFDETFKLRLCSGIETTSFLSRHLLSFTSDFENKKANNSEKNFGGGLEKLSITLKNYFYWEKCTPMLTFNFSAENNLDFSEKLGISASLGKKTCIKAGADCTIQHHKREFQKTEFSASGEIKFVWKQITAAGKISVSF